MTSRLEVHRWLTQPERIWPRYVDDRRQGLALGVPASRLGIGIEPALVAEELAAAAAGYRVHCEEAAFSSAWLGALYGFLRVPVPFDVKPIEDLFTELLPIANAAGVTQLAMQRAHRLHPSVPHTMSTACRAMEALQLVTDRLEIGRAAGG